MNCTLIGGYDLLVSSDECIRSSENHMTLTLVTITIYYTMEVSLKMNGNTYEVTVRLAQGQEKTVNLAEGGQIPAGGVRLIDVIKRAFLNGWDPERNYYVDAEPASQDTLLFGGEAITATKRHDNG